MQNLEQILQNTFGLPSFREGQKNIITSVLNGNDTLVFMPTGGGKSLTYQLPGVVKEGLCLIISPLISLMKDQVDSLKSLGIQAEMLNSTTEHYDRQIILNDISRDDGNIKFLYVAPERLMNRDFLRVIKNINISLVAIDEAHCISEWGHDFRPSYMKVKNFLKDLREEKSFLNQQVSPHPNPLPTGEGIIMYEQKKYNPRYIVELSKKLRQTQTGAESFLWELLRNRKFHNLKFRRQHPFGRYIADFYCHEIGVVIELDGKIHENQKEYDKIRDEFLEAHEVGILRFTNDQVFNETEKVFEKIIPYIPLPLGEARGGQYMNEDKTGKNIGDVMGKEETLKKHSFPVIALTATATQKVRKDIIDRLGLEAPRIFTKGFDRKNIAIVVREIGKKDEKMEKLKEIIEKSPGSGIVYCSSRKSCQEVYEYLQDQKISTGIYTGEMLANRREQNQNAFMNDEYKVIVATNAFGMGIDKKDIRFVVHFNLPGSIENYYQEVGRAGRDGKNSYGVVLASFADTKIQEFFIENSYPSKENILKFYDYLYAEEKMGAGKDKNIFKTYAEMTMQSGLKNDLQVGAVIRILEKYNILRRGTSESDSSFRGRGIQLLLGKISHSQLPIDWNHQEYLEDEAYFKLEQIKKLLFFPRCRKRFILEYFSDEEDLKTLGENCGTCDFCLDKKKNGDAEDIVKISTFVLVLEAVKKYDERFGVGTFVKLFAGSEEKKILEWKLDETEYFGVLSNFSADAIKAIIESLILNEYLYKTDGQYPLLGISETGRIAIVRNYLLQNDNTDLQHFIRARVKQTKVFRKSSSEKQEGGSHPNPLPKGEGITKKGNTYRETLRVFTALIQKQGSEASLSFGGEGIQGGGLIQRIAEIRELKKQTIESHIIQLYKNGELELVKTLALSDFSKLKIIKERVEADFSNRVEKLRDLKEKLPDEISYFDIHLALAMMEKKDL